MQNSTTRIVMIGDQSVGKTSLVYQMCQDQWKNDTRPTVATAFYTLKGDESQNQHDIQIWDTAGAERYRALNSVYYHNAMGGILVFDLTNKTSFDSLNSWVEEFTNLAQAGALIILVGNKCDLIDEFEIKPEDGEKWAKTHNMRYFSTSAKESTNIIELREYILQTLSQRSISFFNSTVSLENSKKNKSGCCN